MTIHTCSEVVSLARELEGQATKFYQGLSKRFVEGKKTFSALAKENQGYFTQVERAYYGVITDAFEGCFAFKMNPDEYRFETDLGKKATYPQAVAKALEIEEKMIRFYEDAAEQSKSLMADVPRAMRLVAKKRGDRESRLKALLKK